MTWGISVSGHTDNQEAAEKIEKLARKVGRLAKEADVGLTYVNFSGQGGSKALYNLASGIDELTEAEKEGDKG